VATLGGHGPLTAVGHMCAQHSSTVTPRGYDRPRAGWGDGAAAVCSQVFLPVLTAIRPVRRFVNDVLAAWGWDALTSEAALVASELATNAVVHTSGPFRVTLERAGHAVTILVEDTSPVMPQRMAPTAATEGGRGLVLVEALAVRSGSEGRDDGKTVWASFEPVVSA
jgi:anti-sigma regulatory factor (Ser/Thr protein kinase)